MADSVTVSGAFQLTGSLDVSKLENSLKSSNSTDAIGSDAIDSLNIAVAVEFSVSLETGHWKKTIP